MEFYFGSFDAVGADWDEAVLNEAPEECSLCTVGSPAWQYEIPPVDARFDSRSGEVALARWWVLCDECHELVGSVELLADRVAGTHGRATPNVLREFVRRAQLRGEMLAP